MHIAQAIDWQRSLEAQIAGIFGRTFRFFFDGMQVRGEQTSLEDCMHLLSMKEQSITQLRQRLEDSEAMVNRLIPAKHGGANSSGPSAAGQSEPAAGDFALSPPHKEKAAS